MTAALGTLCRAGRTVTLSVVADIGGGEAQENLVLRGLVMLDQFHGLAAD